MGTELVHIGFGHLVAMNRVVAVVVPESAPLKRAMKEARDNGTLIDATSGRKTKSLLYLDNGMVLAAAIGPETIAGRLAVWRQGRNAPTDAHEATVDRDGRTAPMDAREAEYA
jgi:regulator of extracellular matrix RemA (YlzA/DUF370 family)